MATAQNVIDRAGGLLKIVNSPGAAVDATTSADMLTVLKDIVAELTEDGGLEIPAPSTLATTLDVGPGVIRGIAYILASDYADYTGRSLQDSNRVHTIAERERGRILGQATVSREISFHKDGLAVPSGRYNINSDS